ncbi:MAG: hypothetical protein DRN95_04525 [Candidatus Hydrothermarchaeota archaeon]|nr:MAG: hypothetical protein DRN95_04525 [Candidatus Hydrothermarchaeota archaeon]
MVHHIIDIIDIIAKKMKNDEEQGISKKKQYKQRLKTIMSTIMSKDDIIVNIIVSKNSAEQVIKETKGFTRSLKMGTIMSIMSIRSLPEAIIG